MESHHLLVQKKNWSTKIYGWHTALGEGSFFIPIPTTLGSFAFQVLKYGTKRVPNPWIMGTAAIIDTGFYLAKLYRQVVNNIDISAKILAEHLLNIEKEIGSNQYRVVAHSLGCKLLHSALLMIPKEKRPCEIHLCAPAIIEEEIYKHITELSSQTYIYYSTRDVTLHFGFRLMETGRIVGVHGLSKDYGENVYFSNVDEYLKDELSVHSKFAQNFYMFAGLKRKDIISEDEVEFDDEDWDHVSKETKSLVQGLLNRNPKERRNCEDVINLAWKVSAQSQSFQKAHKNFKQLVIDRKKHRASMGILGK